MPVSYQPIVPWNARGADPAANYGKGFGLGLQAGQAQAHIAMQRAQLQEAQNRSMLSFALQQQQQERENMLAQQKLEVEKAYKQQQTALNTEKLDQAERLLQEKIKDAAARTIARERFKAAIQQPNADLVRSYIENFGGMEHMGPGMTTALKEFEDRSNPDKVPKVHKLELSDGTTIDVIAGPGGNPHFPPRDKVPTLSPDRAATTLKTLSMLPASRLASMGIDTNALPSMTKMAFDRMQGALRGGTNAQGVSAQEEVLPFPKSKEDAVKGKKYQTKWGVSEWTGTGWRPIDLAPTQSEPSSVQPSEDQYESSDETPE